MLFALTSLGQLRYPVFVVFGDELSWRDVILIGGGLFLIAKATFEIHHAAAGDQSPYSVPLRASPANGYLYPGASFFSSWLDMVSATQKAQPNWMTPLVTVTPRLEQEFRFDFYDQNNGTGTQGNGQNIISYGGPGGTRLEFIPGPTAITSPSDGFSLVSGMMMPPADFSSASMRLTTTRS
jgi:hypothetical protein